MNGLNSKPVILYFVSCGEVEDGFIDYGLMVSWFASSLTKYAENYKKDQLLGFHIYLSTNASITPSASVCSLLNH